MSPAAQAPGLPPVRRDLYRALLRHALTRLFFLYFIPLLLLTLFFHLQYNMVVRDDEQRHRRTLAHHQAALLEMFLGDRLLNLADLTDNPQSLLDPDPRHLEARLRDLQTVSEAFVDLAVLDGRGRVLGYAGPLPELKERNYGFESWFTRLMAGASSHVITDVYLGFRGQPHFTMALKLEPQGKTRILRATLSPDIVLAQLDSSNIPDDYAARGLLADIATNIWLFSALFCLIGGGVIWFQARWVARQQYEARRTEWELNRQLVQAAKLASVGELASGVAHEINNPLAVVSEKAGLIRDLLDPALGPRPDDETLRTHLRAIEQAVFRCSGITSQLLGFVRQSEVRLVECRLEDLIDELIDGLLGPELEVADILVVRDYDPHPAPLFTDPGQLRQVLVNLVKNAADAIAGPGRITLRTRRQDHSVILTVGDTGSGMTPEQLDKVFMPFFTTKAPGKGTGLGLSVSYGIVKGLGGRLEASSTPGRGSEFTVELPLRS